MALWHQNCTVKRLLYRIIDPTILWCNLIISQQKYTRLKFYIPIKIVSPVCRFSFSTTSNVQIHFIPITVYFFLNHMSQFWYYWWILKNAKFSYHLTGWCLELRVLYTSGGWSWQHWIQTNEGSLAQLRPASSSISKCLGAAQRYLRSRSRSNYRRRTWLTICLLTVCFTFVWLSVCLSSVYRCCSICFTSLWLSDKPSLETDLIWLEAGGRIVVIVQTHKQSIRRYSLRVFA